MINYFNLNKGFSLIEIIIAISIIAILSAVVIPNLSSFKDQQVMVNTTEDIISLLNKARNNTISSKNSMTYGIHFQSDKVILFPGITFTDSVNNEQVDLDSRVIIQTGDINLNGGGDDIVFKRLNGETDNNGTITIKLKRDLTKQKVININQIGVASGS